MLIKLDQPKLLSDIINIISELVTEVRLKFDSEGMSMIAVDPANVALVSFKLPPAVFSQYDVEKEVIGISLGNLKSVLRRCGAGSNILLKKEDNNLIVEIHDKIKRVFHLALIDIEGEEKSIPNLEFNNIVELASNDFSDAIEDCAIVGDSCNFIVRDGKFIVEALGLHSARTEFSSDEAKINAKEGKSKYSLEYLQKFNKASRITDKVKLHFSDDYPMKLEFKNNNRELLFILAPRVETGPY